MSKDEEKQLEELLKKWFNEAKWENANFLSRNTIAALIKHELGRLNRWKQPRQRTYPPKNEFYYQLLQRKGL